MSATPQTEDHDEQAIDRNAFAGNRDPALRAALVATGLSALIHGFFLTAVLVFSMLNPTVSVSFESSVGVALMERLGQWEATRANQPHPVEIAHIEEPQQPESEEEEEGASADEEPDPDILQDDEEEAEEPADVPEDSATPDPTPPAPTPTEIAAQREADRVAAEERRARRERRRLRAEEEARRVAEAEESAPEVEREAPETTSPPSEDSRADLPPAERYPEGTLHPVATDVSMWGPEGARVVVMMRNDRLRRSPHRRNVETLLGALPDWRTLVGGANIEPIDDVDAMLIASSDPRWVNRTFVAAVHRLPPDAVTRMLSAGTPGLEWSEENGRVVGRPPEAQRRRDPRIFILPRDDLFLFTRPEFVEPLLADAPRPRGLGDALAWTREEEAEEGDEADEAAPEDGEREPAGGGDADAAARGGDAADGLSGRERLERFGEAAAGALGDGRVDLSGVPRRRSGAAAGDPPTRGDGWINGLMEVARLGGEGPDGPALVATLTGFAELRIEGLGQAAPPREIHLSLGAQRDPAFGGRFVFASRQEAEAFVERWPRILAANRLQLGLAGLFQTFDAIELVVDHNEVVFETTIPRSVVNNFATTLSMTMGNRRR